MSVESTASIEALLQGSTRIWRGRELAHPATRSTGVAELDRALPGGGWPVGTLVEIVPACVGAGEVSLLLPLLRALGSEGRPVTLIRPPHMPYAPAYLQAGVPLACLLWVDVATDEEAHWAAEQTLRSGHAGAVLLWSNTEQARVLRRLQLAAKAGNTFAFAYRPSHTQQQPSPAAVRVALSLRGGHSHL